MADLKRKTLVVILTMMFSTIYLTGCISAEPKNKPPHKNGYRQLTAAEAKAHMKENPNAIIVDVRTAEEYKQQHIPGAVLLPLQLLQGQAPALLPDKSAELLIYCRSGNRSRQAAEQLIAMGYENVYDFGGIQQWPYETVSGD